MTPTGCVVCRVVMTDLPELIEVLEPLVPPGVEV
jgi:hypothetical protein